MSMYKLPPCIFAFYLNDLLCIVNVNTNSYLSMNNFTSLLFPTNLMTNTIPPCTGSTAHMSGEECCYSFISPITHSLPPPSTATLLMTFLL